MIKFVRTAILQLCLTVLVLSSLVSNKANARSIEKDKTAIEAQAKAFSAAFVAGDIDKIMAIYSPDAKIIYGNNPIEDSIKRIREYWAPNKNSEWKLQWHKTNSEELLIDGNLASDIGYYSGLSKHMSGKESAFKGSYIIVWKKLNGVWRMHLDMWNSIKD